MAVNAYDVGDVAPLTLTLDAADDTTTVEVTVTTPTGTERVLAVSPSEDRLEWTTGLAVDEAGTWLTRWTVKGTGAGVEEHTLTARAPARAARAYATSRDLAGWTGQAPPADADVLLARATRLVDRLMVGAAWDAAPGTDNLPADPQVAAAYQDATCAQVAAWLEAGAGDYGDPDEDSDEGDAAELAAFARTVGASSLSFGSVSIGLGSRASASSAAASSSSGPDYTTPADDVVMVLTTAGLFPPRIGVVG